MFEFNPNYTVHPGELLKEALETNNMDIKGFANSIEVRLDLIEDIIAGKEPVSPSMSIKFESVFGISRNIWDNMNANFVFNGNDPAI